MNGITHIGKIHLYEDFEVYLAKNLQEKYQAFMVGNKLFFLRNMPLDEIIDQLLGFATRMYRIKVTGREPHWKDWPDGLHIGDRKVRVQLVESGTEPFEWFTDLDENILLILNSKHPFTLIQRAAKAAVFMFAEWEKATIKRAFKREKPSLIPDVPYLLDSGKPAPKPSHKRTAKPRVKPGELLPQAERDKTLAEGDAILRDMLRGPEGRAMTTEEVPAANGCTLIYEYGDPVGKRPPRLNRVVIMHGGREIAFIEVKKGDRALDAKFYAMLATCNPNLFGRRCGIVWIPPGDNLDSFDPGI